MKKTFKIHEAKEMSNRPKSVSQKKPNRENWAGIPETARARDAQHSPNKIKMVTKDKRVSSTQSCNEESESIKQTFMNK